MFEILESLRIWREERGLNSQSFNLHLQVSFITEEITEYLRAANDSERVDALCDICVFGINGLSIQEEVLTEDITPYNKHDLSIFDIITSLTLSEDEFAFAIKLIIREAFTMLFNMGYDYQLCMKETIKEISSRTGAVDTTTGKWEKFKTDEAKALWYTADYSSCKLGSK